MQTFIKVILAVLILVLFILCLFKLISFSKLFSIEIILVAILDFLNNYEACSYRFINNK